MKLNNRGFAISSIMYIILVFAVILITLTLALLSSRKLILDKIKKETEDNIYGISYHSVINTLKYEAISYAINNNIEKENIKIEDFETSVTQELLEHHELSDKYLTLSKNNDSYDVYLGQTKKITDISKPIENMIGIVDYKIDGNSYQETRSGKNLFDKENPNIIIGYPNNNISAIELSSKQRSIYIKCKQNTQYTISKILSKRFVVAFTDEKPDGDVSIYDYNPRHDYTQFTTYNSGEHNYLVIWLYATDVDTIPFEDVLDTLQIEEGTSSTPYEEYGASPSPEYPSEIISVGDKTKNLIPYPYVDGETKTINGITFTVNNDGTVSANGTATANADFMLATNFQIKEGMTISSGTEGDSSSTQEVLVNGLDGTLLRSYTNSTADHDFESNMILIRIRPGVTVNNLLFKPQLEYDSNATDYGMYGKYKIPVKTSGKNLFGNLQNKWIEVSGNIVSTTDTKSTQQIPCNSGDVFTLSASFPIESNNNILVLSFRDVNGNNVSRHVVNGKKDMSLTATAPDNTAYLVAAHYTAKPDWIQLERGAKVTSYEPYVEPITTNIYLDEPLRKIEIYKDSIDFKSSNLNKKIKYKEFKSTDNWSMYATVEKHFQIGVSDNYFSQTENFVLSNYYLQNKVNGAYYSNRDYAVLSVDGERIRFKNKDCLTLEDWINHLNSLDKYLSAMYVMSQEENATINLPNIQTNVGSSIIEINTTIQPSNVEFTIIEKIKKL